MTRREVSQALRSLGRDSISTTVMVVALALSAGAAIIVFGITDAVYLQRLPYSAPEELALVYSTLEHRPGGRVRVSYPDFADFQEGAASFTGIAALSYASRDAEISGARERVRTAQVSDNFFEVIGVSAQTGRAIQADDDGVALISGQMAKAHFGGVQEALGTTIEVDGIELMIVGVLPDRFAWDLHRPYDLWTVLPASESRRLRGLEVVARLLPATTIAQARDELSALAAHIAVIHPNTNGGVGASLTGLRERRLGHLATPFLVVCAGTLALLLVACLNVSAILVGRIVQRRPELLVRHALGGSWRWPLKRAILESAAVTFAGGLLGLLIAALGLSAVTAHLPSALPRIAEISVQLRTMAFSGVLLSFMTIAAGLLPTLLALRDGRSPQARKYRGNYLGFVIVGESALGVLLLTCAALLTHSFQTLNQAELGFSTENTLTLHAKLPRDKAPSTKTATVLDTARRELFKLPGLSAVAASTSVPLSGFSWSSEIRVPPATREVLISSFSGPYFEALGIPLLEGRLPDASGFEAVVSQTLARGLFPGRSPLARSLELLKGEEGVSYTVVGVVADVRQGSPRSDFGETLYVPFPTAPQFYATFVLRSRADAPAPSISVLKETLGRVSGELVVGGADNLEGLKAELLAEERVLTLLFVGFGVISWVLVLVAVYGIVRLWATWRRGQIGVRLAIGASPTSIVLLFLRRVSVLALLGLVMGVGAGIFGTRYLTAWLYNLTPTDPATFCLAAAVILATAVVGAALPAINASKVDPARCLKEEHKHVGNRIAT